MIKIGDKVKLVEQNCNYTGIVEDIRKKKVHRSGIEKFYIVAWKYEGRETKYDRMKANITDLHFRNEIELAI